MIDADLSERADRLQRFCSILNYELSTVLFYIIHFYWLLTLFLSVLAAILFTPYLIFVLIKEKKYSWLIIFVLLVISPIIIINTFFSKSLFYLAVIQIPVLLFYLYCFMLRFDANEWLREINWKIYRETEEQKSKLDDDFIVLR
ncbi:MAG: hypothetical protein EHM47_09790 [Ignavibacteriales bacterium]|nr:MAG: hypothetical protein EHM47_09790 [Ignavibacteriales bacterium]